MLDFIEKNKNTFLGSALLIFIAHAIKFLNYYPTWDSMFGIKTKWLGMAEFGRWFSGIAEILLSSRYDLQWVEGVVAILFLSLTIVLISDIIKFNSKTSKWISIGLFVVFPSFSATFMYGLWTPAYMLSLFLSTLVVYMCIKSTNKWFIPFGILAMLISIAIYQIYLLFAISLFIIYFIKKLLEKNVDWNHLKKIIIWFSIISIISLILYVIIGKICQKTFNYTLSDYQGVSQVGAISIKSIYNGLWDIIYYLRSFFGGNPGYSIYKILNTIFLLITLLSFILCVIFNKNYDLIRKLMLSVLFIGLFPVTYTLLLVSPGVFYHKLMELGNYFIYLLPLLFFESLEENRIKKIGCYLSISLLTILCYYHFLNNNIAYHQAAMSYEKSYFEVSEVISKIDQVNKNGNINKLLFIGSFKSNETDIIANPIITGASTNNFLQSERHILLFAKYYLNRDYNSCDKDHKSTILSKIDQSTLDCYPHGEYVQVVDDVIVIKLSEEN